MAVVGLPGLLLLAQAPAHATITNPYGLVGTTGYDASYPQCSATVYPTGFAIIGMGGGRPFETSSCYKQQWASAATATSRSLYFNTGYSGAYGHDITTDCTNAASVSGNVPAMPPGTSKRQASVYTQAWEIGCSEADYAYQHEPGTPAMWWADVEIGNSWSSDTTDNDYTLDGLAYEMGTLTTTTGAGGGFYSPPSSWASIAGAGFQTKPAATADWQPATTCTSTSTGFSGSPLWVVQNGSTSAGTTTFDADQSCG